MAASGDESPAHILNSIVHKILIVFDKHNRSKANASNSFLDAKSILVAEHNNVSHTAIESKRAPSLINGGVRIEAIIPGDNATASTNGPLDWSLGTAETNGK